MTEYIYTVYDGNTLLGSFVDIETAAIFIKAYYLEFFNEQIKLVIRREPKKKEMQTDD